MDESAFNDYSDNEYHSAPEPSQSPPLYRSTTPFAPVGELPEEKEIDDEKKSEKPILAVVRSGESEEDDLTKAKRKIHELEGELKRTRSENEELSRKHRAESRQMSDSFVTRILEKEDEVGHIRSTLQIALEEARSELDHLREKFESLQSKVNKQRQEEERQNHTIAHLRSRVEQLVSGNDQLKSNIHLIQQQSTQEIMENVTKTRQLQAELDALRQSKIDLALNTAQEIDSLRGYIRRLGSEQGGTSSYIGVGETGF